MKGRITFKKKYTADHEDFTLVRVYWIDGEEVSEAEFRAAFPDKKGFPMASGIAHRAWPQKSKALAVHRKQVKKANERNHRLGLSTRYEADGTAVIPDRAERTRLCKAEGFYDQNAGYGDFAGNGPKAYQSNLGEEPDFDLSVEKA